MAEGIGRRKLLVSAAGAAALTACGGGGGGGDGPAPQLTLENEGPLLGKTESIVLAFNRTMDPGALRIEGDVPLAADGAWSSRRAQNDTYTLVPRAGAWPVGRRLALRVDAADPGGNRIERRNAEYFVRLQFASGDAAVAVLGQLDFEAHVAWDGNFAYTLMEPVGSAAFAHGELLVADTNGNRVLKFHEQDIAVGAHAAVSLGVGGMDLGVWLPPAARQDRHPLPSKVSIAANRMAVTDSWANRVVIYDGIPADGLQVPSHVVGQASFTTVVEGCSDTRFREVGGACVTEDGKLIVADAGNHRVLVWRSVPNTIDAPADLVLGQPDMESGIPNNTGGAEGDTAGNATLNSPTDVWSDGRRLVVVDTFNHRVLIWKEFPTEHMQPADLVLGQLDFAGNLPNQGGFGSGGDPRTMLNRPRAVACNGHQLAVAEAGNHRVLIWNSFPDRSGQPCDVVLGHSVFDSGAINDGRGLNADTLNGPTGVVFAHDKLVVTDTGNSRALVFKSA